MASRSSGVASYRVPALGDRKHHIYTVYCHDDQADVEPILVFLRACRLKVYDPHRDGVLGRSLFWNWLTNGIEKSKTTIVFLTKSLLRSDDCLYQAQNAVRRAVLTKGHNGVICVMLKSCKVPNYLRQFNCVFAWKYWHQQSESNLRILKAVHAPQERLRPVMCIAPRNRSYTGGMAGHTFTQTRSLDKLPNEKDVIGGLTLLMNVNKVKTVLQNSFICCTTPGCTFFCSGTKILDFHTHIKSDCKYMTSECPNCRQKIQRRSSRKHIMHRCKYRKTICPNEGCRQMLTTSVMRRHVNLCSYREKICSNRRLGCEQVFDMKDTGKHLEICDYESVACDTCAEKLLRCNLDNHLCGYAIVTCKTCGAKVKQMDLACHEAHCNTRITCYNYGCGVSFPKGLLRRHEMECEFAPFSCHNPGCRQVLRKGTILNHERVCVYRQEPCPSCGQKVSVKDIRWHNRDCVKMVQCEKCGMRLPSSGKLTHDNWVCVQQGIQSQCVDCRTCVQHSRLPQHNLHCAVLLAAEQERTHGLVNPGGNIGPIHGVGPGSWGNTGGNSSGRTLARMDTRATTPIVTPGTPTLNGTDNIFLAYVLASSTPEPSASSENLPVNDSWDFKVHITPAYKRLFRQMDKVVCNYRQALQRNRHRH